MHWRKVKLIERAQTKVAPTSTAHLPLLFERFDRTSTFSGRSPGKVGHLHDMTLGRLSLTAEDALITDPNFHDMESAISSLRRK